MVCCSYLFRVWEQSKSRYWKTIENRHLEDQILEVRVPLQEVAELKTGLWNRFRRKCFLAMYFSTWLWMTIHGMLSVTPEVWQASLDQGQAGTVDRGRDASSWYQERGNSGRFRRGWYSCCHRRCLKDTVGVITALNVQKQTATINVELFGRETPVEISFAEIKQM